MRVAAGIFIFLFGMNLMARSLQELEHTSLKRWLNALSRRPWLSFLAAALLSFVIQSSSTVSVIIVGLVAGNMITLPQAFVLLLGCNIGTTVQVPVLRDAVQTAFVIAGLGAFFYWMIAGRTDQKNIALSFVGTALVFAGLNAVLEGLSVLTDSVWFTDTIRNMHAGFSAFFHGLTLTVLLQSSGISLGVVADFLRAGLLALPPALVFLLGANIGTTSTALISTIGGEINAKRTAVLHILINLAGAVLLGPVLWLLLRAGIPQSLPYPPDRVLMGAHVLFNLLSALLFLPLTRRFVRASRLLIPAPMRRRSAADRQPLAEKTSILMLRSSFQALFRSMWAYTKQVFHLFRTMDVRQIERSTQLRENIEQTRERLRGEFFHRMSGLDAGEHDSDYMRLLGNLEDMEILYELSHEVFVLASERIMHQRQTDDVSQVALRGQFKKTLDLVYLCAQIGARDPEEVAVALSGQDDFDTGRAVYVRNILLLVREGKLDEKNAEDLLAVYRVLERMNLAARTLLEREDVSPS